MSFAESKQQLQPINSVDPDNSPYISPQLSPNISNNKVKYQGGHSYN